MNTLLYTLHYLNVMNPNITLSEFIARSLFSREPMAATVMLCHDPSSCDWVLVFCNHPALTMT